MPRSVVLFFVLAAAGIFAGVTLSRRTPGREVSRSSAEVEAATNLTAAASGITALTSDGTPAKSAVPSRTSQTKVFQDQISYLEQQVEALQKENAELRKKAAVASGTPNAPGPSLTPMAGAPCDPDGTPPREEPDFVGIGFELVKLRGIKDIPVSTVTVPRVEVQRRIAAWLATQVSPDHGRLQGRALAALGVIPEPVDTMALKAEFLSHQIGGWYDPDEQTLFLAAPAGDDPSETEPKENALALSYGTLLKRFGPTLYPKHGNITTLDARMSRDCLLSGDAALLRFLHAIQDPKHGGGGGVGEDPDDPSRTVPIPNFLREVELLPFMVGFDFMQAMHSIGDWEQVNAIYQRPPIAGVEVLDANVYLSETPFTLRPIDIPDATVNGAAPFWQDTLGPMTTTILLKQRVPEAIAVATAPGWMNDRLLTYDAGSKPRGHVVWQTLWRDSDAADGFFSAVRQWLQGRYKDAKSSAQGSSGVFQLESGERFIQLQRTHNGTGVILVDAADASFVKSAIQKFAGPAKP
jgi:hypothetical protein